jgi:hypothetical protein
MLKVFVALVCLAALPYSRGAHVVINEIMYHPPDDDQNTLQYIELFNPTAAAVDLSGWKIGGGIKYSFPPKTSLAPGGFVVVARDTVALQRAYGSSVHALGNFTGKLSHKGEKVELTDASGQLVEKLHFHDKAPWPLGPDGYGSSLERICVDAPADDPQNWAASEHPTKGMPGGSPGENNGTASAKPLPVVQNVRWERLAKPAQPLEIAADVSGGAALDKVVLEYRTVRAAKQSQPVDLPMKPVAASGARYTAQIPGQPAGTLVRFTIRATDKQGATRLEPGAAEPRPAFSSLFTEKPERGRIPLLTIINSESMRGGASGRKFGGALPPTHGPGKSAAFYVPPQGDPGEPQLFDFVHFRRRAGGWKVHFFKDQRLEEMSGINVIFEGPPRWVLAEHLSYELYRKAGMNIEKSGHVRLTVDGRMAGYYLYVEQPNKNFLARTGRDETGNLYKVQWMGRNVVDQHEKKTNPGTGHDDITQLVQNLRQKSGAAQWAYISEQFDVDAWVNYYAVNMCIENWDGFFNNHFIYHDLKPGGKWDVIPWDEDKTWGEYDGCPQDYSWYDMPLTMGMNGDPSGRGGGGFFGGGPFGGGAQWWRPGSMISGALLANPQFRQKFEARLRELCTTVFTPENFGPVVQALQQQLRPEVEVKARAAGQDPGSLLRQFDAEIASFQRQLVNRRKYILAKLK